jgi:hypothetical protein
MYTDGWAIAQSVASVALVVVTFPTIAFAAYQLKLGTDAYKATLEQSRISAQQATVSANAASATALGAISAASRELIWKILADKSLHPVLLPDGPKISDEVKQMLIRGLMINFYSFIYECYLLGQIPDASWRAYKAEMNDFFRSDSTKRRWESVKLQHSTAFQDFINYEVLQLPSRQKG